MKKALKIFVGISLMAMLLAGCASIPINNNNNQDPENPPVNNHNFSKEWEHDENEHWHKCLDEGCQEVSDKAAHNFTSVVTDPTENENGFTTYTCSVCGYSYRGDNTGPLGHTHNFATTWEHDENNHWHNCLEDGCSETSDFGAHNFNSVVTAPTTSTGGYTTYTCSVCGYSYKDNYTDPITEDVITSYTFTDKNWNSDNGKWSSSSSGSNFSSGVQITSSLSGINATSPRSFSSVKDVKVTYHTNASRGAGSISVYVGESLISKQSATKQGGTVDRVLDFSANGSLSGNVKLVVECTTNSIYISKVEIEEGEFIPVDPTSITLSSGDFELAAGATKQLTVTYSPSNANQNKDVTWNSDNESVATVSSSGLVTVKDNASVGTSANISATLNVNSYKVTAKLTVVETPIADSTVLIYMCGSDLESGWDGQSTNTRNAGYATADIKEIVNVKNQPDDVNIVIETGGAKAWASTYGISSSKIQRHHVANGKLVTDASLSNASMGSKSTLQSFLEYGLTNYPAARTSLILWNHGGAMTGVCCDEIYDDSLLASEVKSALDGAFAKVGLTVGVDKLEWIGYDACLMAVQDIAEIDSRYFNYMVASEESEAGEGWHYTSWIDDLYAHKDTNTILKAICDGFIAEYERLYGSQGYANDQTLSYLDLSKMSAYKEAFESLASDMSSTIKNNASTFNSVMKTAKNYGDTYLDKDEYQEYLGYGYSSSMFDTVVEDGQTYYLLHGYYDFGTFDVKDTLTKLKANNKFGSFASKITNVINLLNEVIVYSTCGQEAGESHGLCLVCPMDSYFQYTSSETNFSTWRSLVNSRGF